VNIGSLLWDSETTAFGRERLLRNNMKEIKVLVVTVVRGVNVDIVDMIAAGAALRWVQALEKPSGGNVRSGRLARQVWSGPWLSHFFTRDVDRQSQRAVRNVGKRFYTAPMAEIEQPCLSTAMRQPKENGNMIHYAASLC
jgi:hypothetical protein